MKPISFLLAGLALAAAQGRSAPEGARSIAVAAGSGSESGWMLVEIEATVEPGQGYVVEASSDLESWTLASPVLESVSGALEWSRAECPDVARQFYRVVPAPPGLSSTAPQGRLARPEAEGPFVYTTVAGWTVSVQPASVRIEHPGGAHFYELWNSVFENLGGKHIKALLEAQRTLLLPGDVKVTIALEGFDPEDFTHEENLIRHVSIYEGGETHRIDLVREAIVISGAAALHGEGAEHDGETARLVETDEGVLFEHVYFEPLDNPDDPCARAPGERTTETYRLGLQRLEPSNQILDYYDDPRFGHT